MCKREGPEAWCHPINKPSFLYNIKPDLKTELFLFWFYSSFSLPEEDGQSKLKCNTEKDTHARLNNRTAG